jgi:hypothetical protein
MSMWSFDAAVEDIEGDVAAGPIQQIETHAADAAVMQPVQLALRRFVVDATDAAKLAAGIFYRIQGG